ncbi:MAG: ImmA/IrrE family metallo-endopeptidase [bacterium]|nr:ImmA/IrrE family metallo-endopeptidase [bacterium]
MFSKYIYSRESLEKKADEINEKYYPDRLNNVVKLDPYDMVEKMGLDVEWNYLSPNMKILGMIFFDDGVWPIWDDDNYKIGKEPKFKSFKKGTIVINTILTDKKYKCKEVFDCTHEISHWIKDKSYFESHPTDYIHVCKSEDFEKTYWSNGMSELDIIERQTNYLAAAILMPRDLIKKEFFKRLRYKNIPDGTIKYETYMKKVINELAKEFGLNYNPVLYRLYDLNILER